VALEPTALDGVDSRLRPPGAPKVPDAEAVRGPGPPISPGPRLKPPA
jgi:hypothetical protein